MILEKESRNCVRRQALPSCSWGKYAGCTGQVISNIERGYTRPSAEVLNKIADSLHVPSDYILGISKSKWIASNPYSLNRCLQERISSLLKKEQMTIESFAAAAELDQDEVSEIVFGGVQPNTDTLARIAGTLHTTIDYLIGINEYEVSIETEEEKDIIQYFRKCPKAANEYSWECWRRSKTNNTRQETLQCQHTNIS